MFELAPVLGGLLLGLATPRRLTAARRLLLVLGTIVVGALAAALSGELAGSPLYLALDTALALLGAVAGRRLVPVLRTAPGRRRV